MKIGELQEIAHAAALAKGFDDSREIGMDIMLIVSEAAEALEEIRNGRAPDETYYSGGGGAVRHPDGHKSEVCPKPEGVPSEMADVVIRVAHFAGKYGFDLEAAIIEKLEYNKTRAYRHGGKMA